MEYEDSKIVNDFFIKNPDFTKPDDLGKYPVAVVVGDYIYISCLIKTQTTIDYDVTKLPEGYVIADCFDVDGNRLAGIWMSKYDVSYVEVTQEQESENANNIIYKNAD